MTRFSFLLLLLSTFVFATFVFTGCGPNDDSPADAGTDRGLDSASTDTGSDTALDADTGNCLGAAGSLRVCMGSARGEAGDMQRILGMSVQVPGMRDRMDQVIEDGPSGARWAELPRSFFRYPAGTDSFNVNPAQLSYFLETFLPRYDLPNDQTWSPNDSVSISDYDDWTHENLQRIVLGNEPPNHDGEEFADENAYVSFAQSVIEGYPERSAQFWIQSGKPEVLYDGSPLAERGRDIHRRYLAATEAAVMGGALPARIVTTHKLTDDYDDDRLEFYNTLLDDYQARFGDDVQLCFQEYKYKADEQVTEQAVLRVAEFLLIMSRLRLERGDIIDGGAYQQGFGAGTANLIGLNNSTDREWTETGLTDIWQLFASTLATGSYLESASEGRPPTLQAELFEVGGQQYLLFSNNGAAAVPLTLPEGSQMERVDGTLSLLAEPFEGELPARSAGRIRIP